MKKIILITLMIFLISCSVNDNDNAELIGKWKLTHVYSDPGDGSGDFVSVVSDKYIEFFDDSTVVSNGALCTFQPIDGPPDSGIYHTDGKYQNSNENYIVVNNCDDRYPIHFEVKDSKLIVYFLCIEGCAEKYKKIN